MEEALFETPLDRSFAALDTNARAHDRVSILRFRHLLEKHNPAKNTAQLFTLFMLSNQWMVRRKLATGLQE
jgi:IS5 family transposase